MPVNASKTRKRTPEPSSAEAPIKLTRKGLATREKLLDGARNAFSERGYEGARISDIAKEAGFSLGNFYRHFTDKDDILFAVLKPLYEELRNATGRHADAQRVVSEEILAERNRLYFEFYADHRALFRVAREAAASSLSSKFRDMWFEMRGDFIARNKNWLNSLIRSGAAPSGIDTTLMADALGNMNEQIAYTRIALAEKAPSPDEIEALARTLAKLWWRAIFVDEGRTL